MSLRDWIIIGSVVGVLLVVSILSIFGAANMTANTMSGTQPHLAQMYNASNTEQEVVLDAVTQCMTHYSKLDPALWGQNGFDTTPLSAMDEARRQSAAQLIRSRLEVPCLAYGKYSAQRSGQHGPASHLSAQQYMEAALQLGMDTQGAEKWYQERLNRNAESEQ